MKQGLYYRWIHVFDTYGWTGVQELVNMMELDNYYFPWEVDTIVSAKMEYEEALWDVSTSNTIVYHACLATISNLKS